MRNEEWARLEPLLPSAAGKRGHPYRDHRQVINGIRWRTRTGAPWRDIPERYGPWKPCYDRFVRWQRRGLWEKILQVLQGEADEHGSLVWTHGSVDSRIVRAHQPAAGARRPPPSRAKTGKSRLLARHSDTVAAASAPSSTSPSKEKAGHSRSG